MVKNLKHNMTIERFCDNDFGKCVFCLQFSLKLFHKDVAH